jgi:hypothetical protein
MNARGEQQYFIRTFENGDEVSIVRLFDKAYRNYGGYTRKTPENWLWCCLQRPDVERENVLLVSTRENNSIVGYVVIGKSGSLWELAYDPDSNGEKIVALLLKKATEYLERIGASSVNFAFPLKDAVMKRACKKLGFTASLPPKMFLSILSLSTLLYLLANHKAMRLAKLNESIMITVENAPIWIKSPILIQIRNGKVTVEDQNVEQLTSIQLHTNYFTLALILFGNISPLNAFFHSSLKIRPISKILTVLKLLSQLQINNDWTFQMSDYG